jgi:hypothetical protein
MALTATQILTAIAPNLASNPLAAVYLEMSDERTAQGFFGAKREHAIALRAAHMMTVYLSGVRSEGETGSITSKSEGELSVSFGSVSAGPNDDGSLTQTTYGIELLALIKASGPFISVTGAPNYDSIPSAGYYAD